LAGGNSVRLISELKGTNPHWVGPFTLIRSVQLFSDYCLADNPDLSYNLRRR